MPGFSCMLATTGGEKSLACRPLGEGRQQLGAGRRKEEDACRLLGQGHSDALQQGFPMLALEVAVLIYGRCGMACAACCAVQCVRQLGGHGLHEGSRIRGTPKKGMPRKVPHLSGRARNGGRAAISSATRCSFGRYAVGRTRATVASSGACARGSQNMDLS